MTNSIKREEGVKYFSRFMLLYEKAAPIIRHIANLEDLKHGAMPVSPYMLLESNLTLKMILQALRKIPESRDKEFSHIQKELDMSLSNCIKAAEATEKYVTIGRAGQAQMLLGSIINSTVLAQEYFESVSRKLDAFQRKFDQDKLYARTEPLGVDDFLEEKQKTNNKIKDDTGVRISKGSWLQGVVNNIAVGIEYGLGKIGDAIIFPIKAVYRIITRQKRFK